MELMQQNERIARMKSELGTIESTNERLERRIERLDDPDFLEQKAREQIGLVRPDETTYLWCRRAGPARRRRSPSRHRRRLRSPVSPNASSIS